MRLLFVHQNFPGQYVHLARHYAADKANELVAIADSANKRSNLIRTIRYSLPGKSAQRASDMAGTFVDHMARAEAVAVEAEKLRQNGFDPDIILGHFGWGETLFLKDVWPRAKLLVYAEFFTATATLIQISTRNSRLTRCARGCAIAAATARWRWRLCRPIVRWHRRNGSGASSRASCNRRSK